MKVSQSLRRPENWQDFERLCKKLWGEIWKCPGVKKNGRQGQKQHGVDVYGKPLNESGYYGIQVKGKDEYRKKKFTEKEITNEIEKAKLFSPPLKALYFATTGDKDAKIETFIRQKNIENTENGLFEIDIYSWQDITDLIEENRETYDWYVKNIDFKSTNAISVTFQNHNVEMLCKPKFIQQTTHFLEKLPSSYSLKEIYENKLQFLTGFNSKTRVNHSYIPVQFIINNIGTDAIEKYKLQYFLDENVQDIEKSNESYDGFQALLPTNLIPYKSITFFDNRSGEINPEKPTLLSGDRYISDYIFVKPYPKEHFIKIKWKLLSKHSKYDGELKIIIDPEIKQTSVKILAKDFNHIGTEIGKIEDYIIAK